MSEGLSPIYVQWLKEHPLADKSSDEASAVAKNAASKAEAPAAGSSEQPSAAVEPESEPAAEASASQPEPEPQPEPQVAEDKSGPEPELASGRSPAPASYEVVFRPKTEAKRTRAPAQGLSSSRWAPPPSPLVALDALPPKASPPVPRDSMVCPPVPSLAARQHAWKVMFGDGRSGQPVCGPFEVRIPCWIEFEELVWGHSGQTFAKARDVIPRDISISWEVEPASANGGKDASLSVDYEGRPYKLVVGFSKGADHTNRANQSLLMAVFSSVVGWAGLAHIGTSMTLADYLTVNLGRQDAGFIGPLSGPRNPARAFYEQGQENTLAAQQAARKEKSAMDQWRREVHDLTLDLFTRLNN